MYMNLQYSFLEEELKKSKTYSIDGVNLTLNKIEGRLHDNKRTLNCEDNIQRLKENHQYETA